MKRAKTPQPKKVHYALIDPENEAGAVIYARMRALISAHHDELRDARIALAWNTQWKPDVDGRCTLGMCKRASDLDRELTGFDFVIILRREFWDSPLVGEQQRNALLDHELMHATISLDKDGEPKVDERGRVVYRLRKHDIEEFGAVVARWGLYKRDLEWFVKQVQTIEPLSPAEADAVTAPITDDPDERDWYR
jgi:hypothetical protein